MKTRIQILNERLGWIPPYVKIIDNKKYQLFDSVYILDKKQMFDYENQILPLIKSEYNSYRTIIRKNTMAIYVR